MSRHGTVLVVAAVCVLAAVSGSARAALIVDDFSAPVPEVATVIDLLNPDPTLIETANGAILGGERDLLLDVIGTPGQVSHTGTVGEGSLVFNSEQPGTAATLQYDGVDVDPAQALSNAEGLGAIDLTAYGTGMYFIFLSTDGGLQLSTDIEIEVHGAAGSALFTGSIPDSPNPQLYIADFASFVGDNVLGSATSVEVRINPAGNPNVDFELDVIGIPEPTSLTLLGLGGLALLRRRRG